MKNLKVIKDKKYAELQNKDMIDPVPSKAPMYTHNAFLDQHLIKTNRIGIDIAEREYEKKKPQYEEYLESSMEYQILHGTLDGFKYPNIDDFVQRVYDHSQIFTLRAPLFNLPIEFCSPYNTIERFCEEIQEGWTDDRCVILLVNPRLYQYRYRTLSVANIFKDKNTEDVIYSRANRVNGWFIDEVGEPLFFRLPDM